MTVIDLENNKIETADPLARSLFVNNTLSNLNLSHNQIANVDFFGKALKNKYNFGSALLG